MIVAGIQSGCNSQINFQMARLLIMSLVIMKFVFQKI